MLLLLLLLLRLLIYSSSLLDGVLTGLNECFVYRRTYSEVVVVDSIDMVQRPWPRKRAMMMRSRPS